MPKKQSAERPEEQVRRFEAQVQKLIDAGELTPIEADERMNGVVGPALLQQGPRHDKPKES